MSNIKLFESKQIRSIWDEKNQKWYFSVQDVVGVLTDSADVKQYIKRMLSRDESLKNNWGTICTLVEMEAAQYSFVYFIENLKVLNQFAFSKKGIFFRTIFS